MAKQMNDTIIRAYRGENTDYTPAWYMRQAGRSQKEYLEMRKKYTLFEITHEPEICAYVTRLPVENHGNDAAILYKDIMSPLPAMGVNVELKSGIGPVIDNPISSKKDIERLDTLKPDEDVPYILDTIKLLTSEQLSVRWVGVSRAAIRLGGYMSVGGQSDTDSKDKSFMYKNVESWYLLMDKLGDMIIDDAKAQIKPGVSATQIFDSWVGALNAVVFRMY